MLIFPVKSINYVHRLFNMYDNNYSKRRANYEYLLIVLVLIRKD